MNKITCSLHPQSRLTCGSAKWLYAEDRAQHSSQAAILQGADMRGAADEDLKEYIGYVLRSY